MGCDIHLHIEVKVDNIWHHYSAVNIDRWYALFAKMCGVRGSEIPIKEPCELPEDLTFLTKRDLSKWDCDAHSHCWFGKKEIEELAKWYEVNTDQANLYWDLLHTSIYILSNFDDVRLVFWFDN